MLLRWSLTPRPRPLNTAVASVIGSFLQNRGGQIPGQRRGAQYKSERARQRERRENGDEQWDSLKTSGHAPPLGHSNKKTRKTVKHVPLLLRSPVGFRIMVSERGSDVEPPPPEPTVLGATPLPAPPKSAGRVKVKTTISTFDEARMKFAEKYFLKDPRFLYSASDHANHPFNDTVPEVVVLGASNVGKSTLLNALMARPAYARTSKKAGFTKTMNAYCVGSPDSQSLSPSSSSSSSSPSSSGTDQHDEKKPPSIPNDCGLIIMDTPGYGFKSQVQWGDTVVKYIKSRRMLRGAVVLLCGDKKLSENDTWVLHALATANIRTMMVLTKADATGAPATRSSFRSRAGLGGGHLEWANRCFERAAAIREECRRIGRMTGGSWTAEDGWMPDVYITAAETYHHDIPHSHGGIDGLRPAIMELAGVHVDVGDAKRDPKDIPYVGELVPFDKILWKSHKPRKPTKIAHMKALKKALKNKRSGGAPAPSTSS